MLGWPSRARRRRSDAPPAQAPSPGGPGSLDGGSRPRTCRRELVDYDLPVAGAFHNCCLVSIRKSYPGQAQKVMHAIWGLGLLSLTKAVVVVDEWVDVHDYEEVFFRVGANVDPKRDVLISEGPLDHLDHAPSMQFYGGKIGIDATHKGPAEGARPWPEEIRMSDEIRRLVDERWDEYGLGASAEALRQLLRR
ncbi:MAG: hypothetical protein E6G08_20955 [Actinobacteria bacterium]|nr:MAG: hypothetical protein E6G08_20955 [Actinomycetota bacterium]